MLNLSPTDMLWTVVNVFVLYFFLRKFLFKPVTNMIESRQQEIEHNITAAEDQRIKAETMLEEYNDKLKNAGHEASQLVSQAKNRAEHEYQSILKNAHSDAKRLTRETEEQLEADRLTMLAGVRKEVATLALLAAGKIAEHEISLEDDQALLESFLSEVGERT